jgi:VWFA-related protein
MARTPGNKHRLLLCLSCTALLTSTASLSRAQQQPAPIERSAPAPASPTLQQRPPDALPAATATLTAVARAVLLDVVVTDGKGHPVKGLKPNDFVVTEDGAPQNLDSFEEHTAMTPGQVASLTPPVKLPPNTFTNLTAAPNTNASTVILLDSLDTNISAQMYLRQQVIDYMKTVPPGTSIAIFELNTSMRLVQGFTSDPKVLLDAVESTKRNSPTISPLLGGHNYPYRQMRQDSLKSGMQMLGRYLAGFPGRKNLIWFTGVVPSTIYGDGIGNPFQDSTSFIDDMAQTTDVLTLSRVAVYPIDSRGLQTDPAFSAARGGIPRLGTGFETRQFYQHGDLDDVADATGGKAFYNTNGLKQAIAEIVDTGSNYYTIAYTPTNKKWNGQYRQIKIQVDVDHASLQYRHGYYAHNSANRERHHLATLQRRSAGPYNPTAPSTNNSQASSPQDNLAASMALGAIPPTELIFLGSLAPSNKIVKPEKDKPLPEGNFLSAAFQKKPYRDYNILFGMNGHQVQLARTPQGIHQGQVQFVAVLYTDQGEVVNSADANVTMNLSEKTYQSLLQDGLKIHLSIAVPVKGNYFLRLGVLDADGNRVGAMEIPVEEIKLGVAGLGQTITP